MKANLSFFTDIARSIRASPKRGGSHMGANMARQRDNRNGDHSSSGTAESTLVALTTQICGFVHEGVLDSRCAAKLVRRLRKEAAAISEAGKTTKSGQKELARTFDAVDSILRNHDAGLLVAANAALRASVSPG
ncbi:MAG TPA: hypothetical protein VMJ11_11985 [Paraburkholderia sp.]|uniref:hypothetical protein n=1 Tax=Paraburkholderia sp. TaxID=1926495 RepID=UPI002C2B211A|nr:hypothetical protein [Paraburkholderia sp.]HTR07349.1 hypothetical protein [Paraburkholderia sp.]